MPTATLLEALSARDVDAYSKRGSPPNTNDVMGLHVYKMMKAHQSRAAKEKAEAHHKQIHALCLQCQEGILSQCKSCQDACTRPQPGDRVNNDWVMCGDCDGCRARLLYLDKDASDASECDDSS